MCFGTDSTLPKIDNKIVPDFYHLQAVKEESDMRQRLETLQNDINRLVEAADEEVSGAGSHGRVKKWALHPICPTLGLFFLANIPP